MRSSHAHTRRVLDQRLAPWQALDAAVPHRGWVRAIREALGMSATELAARMGVAQSRISAIEDGEQRGAIKLETLQRVADALDCDLRYALVPRSSLADAVLSRARAKAAAHVAEIGHHMRLEDQDVASPDRIDTIEDLARRLIDARGLWTDAGPSA